MNEKHLKVLLLHTKCVSQSTLIRVCIRIQSQRHWNLNYSMKYCIVKSNNHCCLAEDWCKEELTISDKEVKYGSVHPLPSMLAKLLFSQSSLSVPHVPRGRMFKSTGQKHLTIRDSSTVGHWDFN